MINNQKTFIVQKSNPADAASRAAADDFARKLQNIKKAIWSRRTILGEIMGKHGGKTLYEYARDFLDVNPAPRLDKRKAELIAEAENILTGRLGREVAGKVAKQLKKFALVSTTDHHATIDDPFFVNSNIITALPYIEIADPDIRYLVILSFASVSLNNTSGYARGIQFHSKKNPVDGISRVPMFPDKMKMGAVYNTRAYNAEDLARLVTDICRREKNQEIDSEISQKIQNHIREVFHKDHLLGAAHLSEQITKINFDMWPSLFSAASEGARIPDLVYLEIETLVANLLIKHHLDDTNSLIHKIIFDPEYIKQVLDQFEGHGGAFSKSDGWGTYMFWSLDEKNHRVGLMPQGGYLVSVDSRYKYILTLAGIRQALSDRQIFPSMLLCYLMVSLYYGMKCLGGFSQVHDLTMIKNSWIELLKKVGHADEAEAVAPVQTKELGGDGMVLAYLESSDGTPVAATGIDMAIADTKTDFQKFVEHSRSVTLSETMVPVLPEIYAVLYNKTQRDPELAKITATEILRHTGLAKKLLGKK